MQKLPQVLINRKVSKKIPLAELPKSSALIEEIAKKYGDSGRVLVRYSGTEAKCRVMLEGPDKAELQHDAHEIANLIEQEINAQIG